MFTLKRILSTALFQSFLVYHSSNWRATPGSRTKESLLASVGWCGGSCLYLQRRQGRCGHVSFAVIEVARHSQNRSPSKRRHAAVKSSCHSDDSGETRAGSAAICLSAPMWECCYYRSDFQLSAYSRINKNGVCASSWACACVCVCGTDAAV